MVIRLNTLFLSRAGGTEVYFGLDAVPVERGYIILGFRVSQIMVTCDLHVNAWAWELYKRGGLSPFELRHLRDSNPAKFDEDREVWVVEVER